MEPPRRTVVLLGLLLLLTLVLAGCEPGEEDEETVFPFGVASGEVTAASAVLWTRTDQEATLALEVASTPNFAPPLTVRQTIRTTAAADFTAHVLAEPLAPSTTYFYRWRQGDITSVTGTFRTAPAADVPAAVRFAYSGDSDGTRVAGLPVFNTFEVLDAVRREAPDFFVYLGDTIYADSERRLTGPATTLADYRAAYQGNRTIAALPALLQATAIYAVWDDHEVRNNFAGTTVDPLLFAHGRQAFLEYMPLATRQEPADPSCAGAPLFRVVRWGAAVELFLLDARSCRSASVEDVCRGDFVPTLPPALRTQFGLSAAPPLGCLEALFHPARTMLGPLQKARFLEALRTSTATFKIVLNQVPIQQFWGFPYDRWEGYAAERTEILHFLRDQNIRHVLFLTTDTHANVINEVAVDRFAEPAPLAQEFVTGPIATRPLGQDILLQGGIEALAGFHQLLSLAGVDCRALDAFSYGLIEVNAATGTATITLKDHTGALVRDQLNPAVVCQHTVGP